jgi:hypothetical protein
MGRRVRRHTRGEKQLLLQAQHLCWRYNGLAADRRPDNCCRHGRNIVVEQDASAKVQLAARHALRMQLTRRRGQVLDCISRAEGGTAANDRENEMIANLRWGSGWNTFNAIPHGE